MCGINAWNKVLPVILITNYLEHFTVALRDITQAR